MKKRFGLVIGAFVALISISVALVSAQQPQPAQPPEPQL